MYTPSIRSSPTDGRTDFFLPSSRNLFILGDSNCQHPLWDSRGISDPCGENYSTGSSLLTSSPSMILTYLPFYIAPLAVASPMTSPLLPPLSPFPAPGRCFRAWVLITSNSSMCRSLSALLLQQVSPFLQLSESSLGWLCFYFDSHCLSAEEYSSLFLSSAVALFTSLALNAAKSSIPFGHIQRHPKAWWSPEVEGVVSE